MNKWPGGGDDARITGGADGLHESIRKEASQLLAEQLYRAYSLPHNHPCN